MSKIKTAERIKNILQLSKIKISLPVALTGFLGYFRVSQDFSIQVIYTISGILLLAMGASVFNQVQERRTDLLMMRTADRPLPGKKISLFEAIVWGILFSIAGTTLLHLTGSTPAVLLGLFTLAWYNLVYTPLKKITPFAVLPGAVIGALPPLIGWFAAGGSFPDSEIILISMFLFIGQMPHYWLLMMKVGNEFKNAGLPVITEKFSKNQLRNISFIWVLAAAISVFTFPLAGVISNSIFLLMLISGVLVFLIKMYLFAFRGELMEKWKEAFVTQNLFYLFIILMLIAEKFFVP